MEDRRRSPRLPVNMQLSISDLYTQNKISIQNLDSPIEVVDISALGIGFVSECVLPINYFFNTRLELGEDGPAIMSVVKIIRCEAVDRTHYHYGCQFASPTDDISHTIEQFILTEEEIPEIQ